MTAAGWVFLILSWGIIIGLTLYCFLKVFKSVREENGRRLSEKN